MVDIDSEQYEIAREILEQRKILISGLSEKVKEQ